MGAPRVTDHRLVGPLGSFSLSAAGLALAVNLGAPRGAQAAAGGGPRSPRGL